MSYSQRLLELLRLFALAIILILLGLIARELADIAGILHVRPEIIADWRNPPVTKRKVATELSQTIGQVFERHNLPKADAQNLGSIGADRFLDEVERDPTGDSARAFAEWIGSEELATEGATGTVKELLAKSVETAVRPEFWQVAKSIIDALGPNELSEIRKGFLSGLGVLPLDVFKGLVARLFEKDPSIKVYCSTCQSEKTSNRCSPTPAPSPPCVGESRRVVDIGFEPDQPTAALTLTGQQRELIHDIAEYAQASDDATVLLWAWTDTTASKEHNDRLARRRGEAVRGALAQAMVPQERILVAPMGWYGLPRATGPGVPEAANRIVRVEVRSVADPSKIR